MNQYLIERLTTDLGTRGGRLSIAYRPGEPSPWYVGYEYGSDQNPFHSGAAYGMGDTPDEALVAVAEQMGWQTHA
jgi:hypothetical protein